MFVFIWFHFMYFQEYMKYIAYYIHAKYINRYIYINIWKLYKHTFAQSYEGHPKFYVYHTMLINRKERAEPIARPSERNNDIIEPAISMFSGSITLQLTKQHYNVKCMQTPNLEICKIYVIVSPVQDSRSTLICVMLSYFVNYNVNFISISLSA